MPIKGTPSRFMQYNGIYYVEADGSPDGNFYFDRGVYNRSIYIPHESLNAAMLAFTGDVEVSVNIPATARTLRRTLPHRFPQKPWMYVQGISKIKPIGQIEVLNPPASAGEAPGEIPSHIQPGGNLLDGTGIARYMMAEVGLQYNMPDYKIKADSEIINLNVGEPLYSDPDEGNALASGYANSRYVTRHVKRMSKMLTIPRGLLSTTDGKKVLEAIAINENVATFEYTWHQVPESGLPEASWLLGQGTVNDATFDGRPAGTLLFDGAVETKPMPNPITGKILYTVRYQFHSLCIIDDSVDPKVIRGHNWVRKVIGGKIVPVEFSADGVGAVAGTKIFPSYDFRKFFRPDPPTP